jgi:hypothetical protein
MLTVHLLREGGGPARVVPTFFRRMTIDDLFEKIRPAQLSFSGQEPPTIAAEDGEENQEPRFGRNAIAVFVHIQEDPSGAFRPGYYLLKDVSPDDVEGW